MFPFAKACCSGVLVRWHILLCQCLHLLCVVLVLFLFFRDDMLPQPPTLGSRFGRRIKEVFTGFKSGPSRTWKCSLLFLFRPFRLIVTCSIQLYDARVPPCSARLPNRPLQLAAVVPDLVH